MKDSKIQRALYEFYLNEGLNGISFGPEDAYTAKLLNENVKPGIILDVGCAEGFQIQRLENIEKILVGLDISYPKLKVAKIRIKNNNIIWASWNNIPFRNKIFNTTYWLDGIEHAFNPIAVLKEVDYVTNHNLIIGYPTSTPIMFFAETMETSLNRLFLRIFNKPFRGHINIFTRNKIMKILSNIEYHSIRYIDNTPHHSMFIQSKLGSYALFIKIGHLIGLKLKEKQCIYSAFINIKLKKHI